MKVWGLHTAKEGGRKGGRSGRRERKDSAFRSRGVDPGVPTPKWHGRGAGCHGPDATLCTEAAPPSRLLALHMGNTPCSTLHRRPGWCPPPPPHTLSIFNLKSARFSI